MNNLQDYSSEIKEGTWSFSENIEEAINGTDAVVVLTEWEEYRRINWKKAAKKMRNPAWVFDARSITNKKDIKDAGIKLWKIGDGLI